MNTQADTYFLKALACYPNNLHESFEAINYALSYDDTNPDAHCLMGRFYMEQLNKYDLAKFHFEMALLNDINHINTYYYFIRWSIDTENLERALNLISYAQKIEGICQATLLHRKGTAHEKLKNYKKAKKLYTNAIKTGIFNSDINFYKSEKARVIAKMTKHKKNK